MLRCASQIRKLVEKGEDEEELERETLAFASGKALAWCEIGESSMTEGLGELYFFRDRIFIPIKTKSREKAFFSQIWVVP